MKNLKGMSVVLFALMTTCLSAQDITENSDKKQPSVQKYTVMEKFEPDYVIPVDERRRLKTERRELVAHRKSILDTLNISDRRRQRLMRDLNKNPFSDKVNRKFAEIEFVDESEVVDDN